MNLPLGTSVYDAQTNELIIDILETGQTHIICEGGRGGRGNASFKSSFNRAPTLHENGDIGEEKNIIFKLKYIADVGLVGLPNAGKSTLVGQISNAKPKTANYQFTTLTPVLGTVTKQQNKMVFADLPGLIEGASEGKGLGHEFLKHIERCSILIHLISLNPLDNIDVIKAYKTINNELKKYSKVISQKPIIYVANKIDVNDATRNLTKLKKGIKSKIYVISALHRIGIDELLDDIFQKFNKIQLENKKRLLGKITKTKIIELKQQKDYAKDLKIKQIDNNQ
jgi:GTP-binding protein